MDVNIAHIESGFAGSCERLFSCHPDISEQVRIVGEVAERLAFAASGSATA